MACVPKDFRCNLDIPSGPVLVVFFARLMAAVVICVVNSGGCNVQSVRHAGVGGCVCLLVCGGAYWF